MSRALVALVLLVLLATVVVLVMPHGGHEIIKSDAAQHHAAGSSDDNERGRGDKIDVGDLGGGHDVDAGAAEQAVGANAADASSTKKRKGQNAAPPSSVAPREQHNSAAALLVDASKFHRTSHFNASLAFALQQDLLPAAVRQLYSGSVMPLFVPPQSLSELAERLRRTAASYYDEDGKGHDAAGKQASDENNQQGGGALDGGAALRRPLGLDGEEINALCDWREKESGSNVAFALEFARILRDRFPPERGGALDGSGLHWFLDEGGLIGSSRAGALRNADDDFDFFLLLPHLHRLCRPDSLTCTADEFNRVIHAFLMVFHREGMCINKFSPALARFQSRGRLMYSFQLNRGKGADPERCFDEKKPFAHMHLGIFNAKGAVCTNVWIPAHSTHPKDELHLDDMLPVTRCRAGPVDVPCPQNITGFLTVRNRGEYRKRSADGSCLIVKKKWSDARKKRQAETLEALDKCGYNSIVDLLPEFRASGFKNC